MKILALDTTGIVAGVAVVDEEKTIGEFQMNLKLNHSVSILPMVEQLLKLLRMDLSDMDYIACANGPGSFTGLRIGGATAKALAHGANKKIVPVPTLEALAYNILDSERLIVPVMDARRNQVYTAVYQSEEGHLRSLYEPMAEDVDTLLDLIDTIGKKAIFLGDGIFAYHDKIKKRGHQIAGINHQLQRASSVGAVALSIIKESGSVNYHEFTLTYLRKPQAEREYERTHLND